MSDQGRWFKLHGNALTDQGLEELSLEDFARWVRLGVYIKVHGTNGGVTLKRPALTLQRLMRIDGSSGSDGYAKLLQILSDFPNCKVHETDRYIDVTFSNWHKYQGDMSTPRVRRWRSDVTNRNKEMERAKNRSRSRSRSRTEQKKSIYPPTGDTGSARSKPGSNHKRVTQAHQRVVNRFLELKEMDTTNKELVNAWFARHSRSAVALIRESGGVDHAIEALEWGAEYFNRKGLSWTIDTIAKHLPDFAAYGSDDALAEKQGLNRRQINNFRQLATWIKPEADETRNSQSSRVIDASVSQSGD